MERLTDYHVGESGAYMMCSGNCRGGLCEDCEELEKIINRLSAYEDTGLEPKDIEALQKREQGLAELLVNVSCGCAVPYTRLAELAQAEKDGRLVVLDEPRKPLVWGDCDHNSILCPNCNHDLMGGFMKVEYCEKPMYQCPYCGCSVDCTKALTREEAEAALKKREEADNETD